MKDLRAMLPYPPPFQDLATLAAHICAAESTIENWVKQGLFPPPKKVGGKRHRSAQIDPKNDRGLFWKYCLRTIAGAKTRASAKGIPCTIDAHFVDALLVDQGWRCAVSGIVLKPPKIVPGVWSRDPFGPSLDRKIPALGYVPGNVRVVCNIVNTAMSEWGLESLLVLFEAMKGPRA